MRWLVVLILPIPCVAQTDSAVCEPSRETIKALESLPPAQDFSISFEDRIGPRRALAQKHPDDIFIQRDYQNAFKRPSNPAGEFDRALAMYRARSGAMPRYLEARLLTLAAPSKSRATFESLLGENPKFAWPYLDMLEWTRMPGARDTKSAEANLKSFIAVCPGAPEAYDDFTMIQDPDLVRKAAENLRNALVRRNTILDLSRWPALWRFERRAGVDTSELKRRIQADLKSIEALVPAPRLEMVSVYGAASELLEDPAVLTSFEAKVERDAPGSAVNAMLVRGKWSRENRPPTMGSTPEQRKAYDESRAAAVAAWRSRWPNDCGLIHEQWQQIHMRVSNEAQPAAEKTLAVIDDVLKCRARVPDASASVPPLETMVASVYVSLKVRLEQVPRLLDEGLRASEKEQRYRPSTELFPAEMRARANENDKLVEERTQLIRADYLAAVGRLDEARTLIEQELSRISQAPETQRSKQFTTPEWRRRLAGIAEKQDRPDEALALFRTSLRGIPRQALSNVTYPPLVHIKQYYLAHGGSEEKWLDWAASPGTDPEPQRRRIEFPAALPEFSAKDLAGRAWGLANLKGKATFINFWATWCGPCRGEHPAIQALYEKVKDRKNLQVLTLSVDEDPETVKAYMKEKGYTFPVIHATELADRLFPFVGLPTNLLVNAEARRSSLYGFAGGEAGLDRVIADMEEAAKK